MIFDPKYTPGTLQYLQAAGPRHHDEYLRTSGDGRGGRVGGDGVSRAGTERRRR